MKDYEIIATYLNGCAGAAHPQTSFEEAELNAPEDYVRMKHGAKFDRFTKTVNENGQIVFRLDDGCVSYIYEFTEV